MDERDGGTEDAVQTATQLGAVMTSAATESETQASVREPSFKYAAFVSYRRGLDTRLTASLFEALETYRIPKRIRQEHGLGKRIGRLFRDNEELSAASSLPDAIRDALSKSAFLIVICSPEARESEWIELELQTFIELGRKDRILAVLARGEVAEAFPNAIIAHNLDPLAIDLRGLTPRARRRKLSTEKLRLLARMIGCDFDALRQRDTQRSLARLRWVAGVALLVAAAAVIVLTYVVRLRDVSEKRRIASEARLAAADGALDRLDLVIENRIDRGAEPSEIKGDLVTLISETRHGLASTGADNRDEDDIELMTHFRRGEIATAHTDFATAMQEYQTAIDHGEVALTQHPVDVALLHDVAVSHQRLALVMSRVNDPTRAANELGHAIAESERLILYAPADKTALLNLCQQYEELGEQQADDAALAAYDKALECARDPRLGAESAEVDNAVATMHRHRAEIHRRRGKLRDAIEDLRAAIAASEPIVDSHLVAPADLSDDYFELATLLENDGNLLDATTELVKGGQFLDEYIRTNPQSAIALRAAWLVRSRILRNQAKFHDDAAVASALQAFLGVDELVRSRVEASTGELERYVEDCLGLAIRLRALGFPGAAAAVAGRALDSVNRSVDRSQQPSNAALVLVRDLESFNEVLEPEVTKGVAHAAIVVCHDHPPIDDLRALRCGYAHLELATLALDRGDLKEGVAEAQAAAMTRLRGDRSREFLRFQVAVANARTRAIGRSGNLKRARSMNSDTLPLAHELAAASSPGEIELDHELLSETLEFAADLAERPSLDIRLAFLRESSALLDTSTSRVGELRRDSVYVKLVRALVERHESAIARGQLLLINELIDSRVTADGFSDVATLRVTATARAAEVELSAEDKDKDRCESALHELEELATRYGNRQTRTELVPLRARCAAISRPDAQASTPKPSLAVPSQRLQAIPPKTHAP